MATKVAWPRQISMNYLSHYRFEPYGLHPNQVVGLILPDLSRLRGKGFRLKALENIKLSSDLELINDGVKRHLAADAIWHGSTELVGLQKAIGVHLATFKIELPRAYFFTHIAAELFLDRFLIENEPHLAPGFYTLLQKVKPANLKEYLNQSSQPNLAVAIGAEFDRFKHARFLEKYVDDNHLLAVLKGIYLGVVKTELRLELADLNQLYHTLHPKLTEVYGKLFTPWPI